jgi:hypothetical protein
VVESERSMSVGVVMWLDGRGTEDAGVGTGELNEKATDSEAGILFGAAM